MRELTTNEVIEIGAGVSPEMLILAPLSGFGLVLGVTALVGIESASIVAIISLGLYSMLVCC